MNTYSMDYIGLIFGRLRVIRKDVSKSINKQYLVCVCECGSTKSVRADHLKSGRIVSCGCRMRQVGKEVNMKHGHSVGDKLSSEYTSWRAMKQRCNSKSYHARHVYANVKICDRWINSFEEFLKDMGNKPSPEYTLDRYPNNSGNYEPSNCRWATIEQQQRNRTNNKTRP